MNIFYYFIVLYGAIIFVMAIQQWQNLARQSAIINDKGEQAAKLTEFHSVDHRAIIIENSVTLSNLNNIEKDLSAKLRISGLLMIAVAFLSLIGVFPLDRKFFAMTGMMIFVMVIVLPAIIINFSVSSRVKKMMNALPYFVDLLAVCVQSGMTVESSIKFIAERSDELDKNLSSLMMLLVKRSEVSSMEDGLMDMYRSMEMPEIRMFCTLLQQSVHYGTSLYENLLQLSKDMREAQLLISEEKIGSLSAKMSIPLILFIMFPITILIAAPGILRIMQNAHFG